MSKTENLELTWSEIQYLYCVVADQIDSSTYYSYKWQDREKFCKMRQKIFDKITETYDMLDPEKTE